MSFVFFAILSLFTNGVLSQELFTNSTQSEELCVCGKEKINSRIVGGEESEENALPWMAFILIVKNNGRRSHCGGAIINDRYILTAAHCLVNARKVSVTYGVNKVVRYNPDYFNETNGWKIHEEYDISTLANDIALIETKEIITFSDEVSPICLPQTNEKAAGEFTVAGWGRTENGYGSETLLQVDVTEYDFNSCNRAHKYRLTEKQICAGNRNRDSCQGDSGGPLMQRSAGRIVAAGIVSYGPRMCGVRRDAVYTRVEAYLDWIKENSVAGKICDME